MDLYWLHHQTVDPPSSLVKAKINPQGRRNFGLDGDNRRRLTEGPADVYPELSPDGSQLAFLREGSLHVADENGATPTCVATNHLLAAAPRWRP